MFQSVCFFYVGIVFLFLISHTRGQQSRVFSTNEQLDWFDARRKCTLLTNERNFSASPTRLGWTNYSAKYLPWVEYLGCFQFRNVSRFYGLAKQVTEGNQLQECIVHCNGSQFLGLQESTCICLHNPNRNDLYGYISNSCDTNVKTCSGDQFALCGTEGGRDLLSVYQKDTSIQRYNRYKHGNIGNCLVFDKNQNFKANNCSEILFPLCLDVVDKRFNTGNNTKSNWRNAFNYCLRRSRASSFSNVKTKQLSIRDKVWLCNIRRWTSINDAVGHPKFCVAAKIKQNGDVERFIHLCRNKLPGLCIEVRRTSPSKTFSTLSTVSVFSSRLEKTSPFLRSNTFQGLTISKYSTSQRTSFLSQQSTSPAVRQTTGISKIVQKATFFTQDFQETTFPVLVESSLADLPDKEGFSAIAIIAIIAATIMIVIIILVTVVICKRKKITQVPISNESLAMVGKEVMYAQVNKPIVEREKSTSSQKSPPAASDDTYDHMDHRRISQTHNPTESNYDTMRSIANAGEEENNYDHVTGTKMEHKRFVVDGASNYSHVEVEFHEVEDI